MDAENTFFVYAINSLSHDWVDVGMTNNLARRIQEHNKGQNRSTKPYVPFELIYSESHSSREIARKREKYFKSGSGKKWLKKHHAQQKT